MPQFVFSMRPVSSSRRVVNLLLTMLAFTAAGTNAQEASVAAGQTKAATCSACHGPDGNSVTPEWPSLAGQHAKYIVRQLEAYRDGERENVTMLPFATMLTEQDMRDIGAFYEAQTLLPKGADPELVSLGEDIYRGGVPDRGIPGCIACHGPAGQGNPFAAYPRISGQHAAYTILTLEEYAAGTRRSDAQNNQMMRNVAELLLENEIRAVASYIQGLR